MIVLVVLLIVFIFVIIIAMVGTEKNSNGKSSFKKTSGKIYFGIVSVISLFAFIVLYGIAIYSTVDFYIIGNTEDNYRSHRELEECRNQSKRPVVDLEAEAKPTAEEIKECEARAIEGLVIERKLNLKRDLITGGVWGTIFLILFLLHYPRFRKRD